MRDYTPQRASMDAIDDALPVMLWRARPDMSCEYVSREWLEFTGCTEEQALGDGWSRGVHAEDLARWLDISVRAFDVRAPYEIEYRLRRRDGEYRWVLDRARPRFAADGAFLGFVGTSIDIDDRKRAEQELARSLERERRLRTATEEASRLKDGFLVTVLRDLRSPVQAIAAWAGHLREQVGSSAEAVQALEAIEQNARSQDRLLSRLLELSQASQSEPKRERVGGERLLEGVRVLIMDADPAARETIDRMLGIAGAETCVTASPREALQALPSFHPDVVLADVGRASEGAQLIGALRALPAEHGSLRTAALTSEPPTGERLRSVVGGFDAQLAKPVEPVALLATVARLAQPAGL